jgi:glycosyltransferase involved in cell wall biosynthesis
MKVLHVITGLNNGGAEGVLYRLCKYDTEHEHVVVSLMDKGKYGLLLEKEGIEVLCLNMPQGRLTLSGVWALFQRLRNDKPDVVQTWMYHADLIGGGVALIAGIKNVFWNVRNTSLMPDVIKRSTIFIAKLCALVSGRLPKKIIYCAHKAKLAHEMLGYKAGRGVVIGNGYDLAQLTYDAAASSLLRSEIGVLPNEILIGMVGRFDPQKDHNNLIKALSLVKNTGLPFKAILVGKGLDYSNSQFLQCIEEYRLSEHIILLEQRNDIATVMSAMALHVLSSLDEAFPNVLAEAMACGTPCLTTDVGDAAIIVGDTGWIVPPSDPKALAKAMLEAMDEKQNDPQAWQARKQACRKRIVDHYAIDRMLTDYRRIWFDK